MFQWSLILPTGLSGKGRAVPACKYVAFSTLCLLAGAI
jgi:hypothetical protein